MTKNKYRVLWVFILLSFLLFLKIDFRFTNGIYCCSDDFDYFIHAETIAIDFDLNYSNQLKNIESKRFYKNGIPAPIGFFGSGLLSAPFLFFGNLVDNLIGTNSLNSSLMNYSIFVYSLSSVFYLFLTINFIEKTLKELKIKFKFSQLLIFFSASGIIYYAFERFSMTHVYESFMASLILYFSSKFYNSDTKNNFYSILIPISISIGLMVRWTNYYLFLLPLVIKLMTTSEKKLLKSLYFYFSLLISIIIFLGHTKAIYGVFTFDPRYVYLKGNVSLDSILIDSQVSNIFLSYLKSFVTILFTQEFGILYFSPIIFFSLALIFYSFFKNLIIKRNIDILSFILLMAYGQVFFTVIIWKSPASAYGFRYLLTLSSLSIICYFYFLDKYKFKYMNKFLLAISIFSLLSVLFFETTVGTQLSLEPTLNSFGKQSRYTSRYYLTELIPSFFVFTSYLKIFTTSFLGALIFKGLISFFGINPLIDLLSTYGLPVDNPDFINYLDELSSIPIDKFIFAVVVGVVISSSVIKKVKNSNLEF